MDENKEKRLIIAKRIKLKFVSELISSIFIFVILLGLLILGLMNDLLGTIIICGLLLVGFTIYAFFYLRSLYINNHSNAILITYKNSVFTIEDGIEQLNINKTDIVDLDYKLKKSLIWTPYFYSTQTWNYGKLIIFFTSEGQGYKVKIKNVAEVDKVFDKMIEILGWNILEDENSEI